MPLRGSQPCCGADPTEGGPGEDGVPPAVPLPCDTLVHAPAGCRGEEGTAPARGVVPRHSEHTFGTWLRKDRRTRITPAAAGTPPSPPGSRGEHMPYASPPVPRNTLNRGIKHHPLQPGAAEPRLWLIFQHSRERLGCCKNGSSLGEPHPGSACRASPPRNEPSGIPYWSRNPILVLESHIAPGIPAQSQGQQGAGFGVPPLATDGYRGNQRVLKKKSSALCHHQLKQIFMSI